MFGDGFDPEQIVRTPVGTINMDMLDCNNILLNYVINDIPGTQNLARTFRLEDQECIEGDGLAALFSDR